jgi:hypothetical protein
MFPRILTMIIVRESSEVLIIYPDDPDKSLPTKAGSSLDTWWMGTISWGHFIISDHPVGPVPITTIWL